MLCPGAEGKSWDKPLEKFCARAAQWASFHLGLFYNIRAFYMYVLPVLSFVMQLEPDSYDITDCFNQVLRALAPGPVCQAMADDLLHLADGCYWPMQFVDPAWLSFSAKLRVVEKVAPDCSARGGAGRSAGGVRGAAVRAVASQMLFLCACSGRLARLGTRGDEVEHSGGVERAARVVLPGSCLETHPASG
ncbi:unnamed protein product [Prorocentrum cordatum]|uniref:Uncharacterized protein n=1 Tax=Prorocentrum cordatum TaxID=2364126 RepID=A0ABN9X9S3_9DINO|nr:unnamed protein product [Polarella glacialis]